MTVYGVGEVIYPRVGLPPCATCTHPSDQHRYVVVSDTKMAAAGCDVGRFHLADRACACARYVAPEGTVQAPGTTAPPTKEEVYARYPDDAMSILSELDAPTVRCRQPLCRAPLWFGTTRVNNRRCPFDIKPNGERTGTSHWRTCPDRPEPTRKAGTRKRTAR